MRLFTRTRRVRVHLREDGAPSIEGFWVGNGGGHYRLVQATHIESAERSYPLEGEAWIPAANVLYLQVLA